MVDVGFARFFNEKEESTERFFINITDVGIGGELVIMKEKMQRYFSPKFNYMASILYVMATFKKNKVRITTDKTLYQGKILNFVIANGKYFGNAIGIAPQAVIDDGQFSITNIGNVSLLDYFLNIGTAKKCLKINHLQVSYFEAKKVFIESTDHRKMTIDMDGEFVGFVPIELECLDKKISFLK